MTPGTGRWLAPLGASAAVLAVLVVPGAVVYAGSADHAPDGIQTPDEPVTPTLPPAGVEVRALRLRPVDIAGYRASGSDLTVYFVVDRSTNCTNRIETPVVQEGPRSVVVRLVRQPTRSAEQVCPNPPATSSVDITLARPMGGRVLRDGSRGQALVAPVPGTRTPSVPSTPPASRAGR